MKVPSNIITTGKYTIGNEFIDKKTHKPYQGYYYEINGKTFAGKEFKNNAPEIVKASSLTLNPLFNLGTLLFKKLSKLNLDPNKPSSSIYNGEENLRYFLKQNNVSPILIREVNKETVNQFKNNPLFTYVVLSYSAKNGFNTNEVKEAEKKMIGITEFIKNLNYNPISDTDTYPIGQG